MQDSSLVALPLTAGYETWLKREAKSYHSHWVQQNAALLSSGSAVETMQETCHSLPLKIIDTSNSLWPSRARLRQNYHSTSNSSLHSLPSQTTNIVLCSMFCALAMWTGAISNHYLCNNRGCASGEAVRTTGKIKFSHFRVGLCCLCMPHNSYRVTLIPKHQLPKHSTSISTKL